MKPSQGLSPDDPQPLRLSELYHENSKQRRNDLDFNRRVYLANSNPDFHLLLARAFKHYPGAVRIDLADVPEERATDNSAEGLALLRGRRSVRRFEDRALGLADVSRLLQATAGITGLLEASDGGANQPVRAAPSAGALYPIETYLACLQVEGVDPGVYHYRVDRHALERVAGGTPRPVLAEATFDPRLLENAAVALVFTGVFGRSAFKYGERGYRFALLEAGHMCQNALLAARLLGLGGVPVGGFIDDEINALLDLDGVDEAALYMSVIGHPVPEAASADMEEADMEEAAARFLRNLAKNLDHD